MRKQDWIVHGAHRHSGDERVVKIAAVDRDEAIKLAGIEYALVVSKVEPVMPPRGPSAPLPPAGTPSTTQPLVFASNACFIAAAFLALLGLIGTVGNVIGFVNASSGVDRVIYTIGILSALATLAAAVVAGTVGLIAIGVQRLINTSMRKDKVG